MQSNILSILKRDALEIERSLTCSRLEAFKLAVEIWKGESLESISFFLQQDADLREAAEIFINSIKTK